MLNAADAGEAFFMLLRDDREEGAVNFTLEANCVVMLDAANIGEASFVAFINNSE